MTAGAISARGLEKRFGAVAALRGVDLDVPVGSVLAVLGPNGAGKSTLLRLLAGLMRPSAGTLEVGARGEDRRLRRGRVGFIGHSTLLYPELTARENLRFAGQLYRVENLAARIDSLLEEHDLATVADRRAGDFSRGLAQRLAIARGLVHDPSVVLLDEPFTGLDRRAAARLGEQLAAIRSERRTVVLVTHDLTRAAELADEAIVLSCGRIQHRSNAGPFDPATLEQAYLAAVDAAP